jgi:ribose transport system substrate-binding protein
MNAKKYTLLTSIVILAVILTGCASAPATTQAAPPPATAMPTALPATTMPTVAPATAAPATAAPAFDCKGKNFAYASFGSQFAYIATVDQSVRDAAKAAGINLLFLDNKDDAGQAMTNAETIAARGNIDIVLWFNYFQAENNSIAEVFSAAKIPAIAIDIVMPGAVYYGANNYIAGEVAGEGLAAAASAKWPNTPVDLLMVESQKASGQGEIADRTNGIIAGVQKAMPNLPAADIIQFEGGLNPDAAASGATAVLTAHPNAKHVIVGMLGDSNAIAVLNAAAAANRDILASGIGADQVGIAALRTGTPAGFAGTTTFFPENYGKDLIPLACDILAGKQVPPEVYIKHSFLTAANLNQFYPATTPTATP